MLDCTQLPKIACIYKIVNLLEPSKFYIGSCSNLRQRITRHIKELKDNKHYNPKLQNAVNKYGINNFNVHIIEFSTGSREILYKQEQQLIDLFDPYYNCTKEVFISKYNNDAEIKEKIRIKIQGQFKNSNTNIANITFSEGTYLVKVCRNNKLYQLCKYKDLNKAKEIADKFRFASEEQIISYLETKRINKENTKTTQYTGIYYRKSKNSYRVCVRVNKKSLEIGSSKDLNAAIRIYNNYITINFIDKPLHIIKSE